MEDSEQKIYLSESEVFETNHPFDINPLIYYRVKPGFHALVEQLPLIELKDIYGEPLNNSQVHFTVKKISLVAQEEEEDDLMKLLTEEQRDHMTKLNEFTEDMD